MTNLFSELRRRNVFRFGIAYLVGAWLITQVVANVAPILGLPPAFGKGVLLVLALGFPAALMFSWIYELTPEGLQKTSAVPEAQSISAKTGRKFDIAILAGLALVVVLFVGDRLTRDASLPADPAASGPVADAGAAGVQTISAPGDASVAVLPFVNRSAREEDAFFADGVHDDLLTQLAKISTLRVISRTSVVGYKGTTKKIPEIAKELGVAVILEGAVQRAGDRVRINVQLIDGTSDAHLWAENYDRALTTENIFDIQAEIAGVIAAALKTALKIEERSAIATAPTRNIEAYEAFVRGNLLSRFDDSTIGNYRMALASFETAARLDPTFAAAHAAAAKANLDLFWTYGENERLEAARAALDRAEALAPDAAETLIALAYYHYWGFFDYARADALLSRALDKAPNSVAFLARGFVARRDGRPADAIEAFERALEIDPLNLETAAELADTSGYFGDFAAAGNALERARKINPDAAWLPVYEANFWMLQGDAARAWAASAAASAESGELFDARFLHAVNTRDPKHIAFALEAWPSDQRRMTRCPEAYELARVEALLTAGKRREAEAVIAEIEARLKTSRFAPSASAQTQNIFFRADLAGYKGEIAAVRAAEKEYLEAPKDAHLDRHRLLSFAKAFVRAGDSGRALDYLERLAAYFGPASYLHFSIVPALDPIRGHKRYLALKADYEAWAAENTDE